MRQGLGILVLLTCAVTGCGISTGGSPPTPTPLPLPTPIPTPRPVPTRPAGPPATPPSIPTPMPLYSQQRVGPGTYQLLNNFTDQFVEVLAGGVRRVCSRGTSSGCMRYVLISATEYSGNTTVKVSPGQFALRSASGKGYAPARQAARVVAPTDMLRATVLTPDDDGDFVSGKLVFIVPSRATRFSLLWRGRHVATFMITSRGKLRETR